MVDERKSENLTAEMIRKRLGFSTIAMPGDEPIGARQIAMIREAGITRVELCGLHQPTHYDFHNRAQVSEIISESQKQGISIVSVHGPGLPYDCPYEAVRIAVVKETTTSARIAQQMGASVFVAHFNANERSEKTVNEVLENLTDIEIILAIENLPSGPDVTDCCDLVDRVGCDRFGIAIDIGHPCDLDGVNPFVKAGRAREVLSICEDRLVHLHLHDVIESDHYPPFDGKVRWDETFYGLMDIGYAGEFMFEAGAMVSLEDTLQKTANFPNEFMRRFGG